jgi:CRISPR/Cas system-associated exonuclease Cas4 (RecB family)
MIKLSRSKLELSLGCSRCFWLDMKKGVKRPPSLPYTINSAIDGLLKREFDVHRQEGTPHYLLKRYNIDAIPYKCDKIDVWRHNFTGIQFHHKPTDFLVYGAVDDIWINPQGELMVVDYKSTGANNHQIYPEYKRQMEIYQWLLAKNNHKISKTGYFLFAKVNKEGGFSAGRLSFDLFIEPQEGDISWVEESIFEAKKVLDGSLPQHSPNCPYCQFAKIQSGTTYA